MNTTSKSAIMSPFAVINYEFIVWLLCPLVIYAILKRRYLSTTWQCIKQQATSRYESPVGKAILITGADTGFGSLFAECLVQMGYTVFAGCLNAAVAAASFAELKRSHCDSFHIVQMDVTSDEQVTLAKGTVSDWLVSHSSSSLYGIISNAGIAYPMVPLELCSMSSFNNVLNINVYGALRVFKAFLPLIRAGHCYQSSDNKRNGGRIVVVSSLACELTAPMMSAYCASKWALTAVSDTLRYELGRFGISVSVILPDLYKTQLVLNRCGLHASLDREVLAMDPSVLDAYGGKEGIGQMRHLIDSMESHANPNLSPVVEAVVDAICGKKPKRRYYPISWQSSFVTALARWFPSLLDNMVTAALRYNRYDHANNNDRPNP